MKISFTKILIVFMAITVLFTRRAPCELVPSAFIDIGYGARAAGMGNAFTSVVNDATSIVWNPAGLTQFDKREITAMAGYQKSLIPYSFAAIGLGRCDAMGAAIGVGLICSGDTALFERTFIFSYAQALTSIPELDDMPPGLNFGINAKLRYAEFGRNADGGTEQVTGNAQGYGVDFGILYTPSEQAVIGLCSKDIYNTLNWTSSVSGVTSAYEEPLLRQTILGLSYRIPDKLLILGFDFTDSGKFNAGIEKGFTRCLLMRAGTSFSLRNHSENYQYSLGFGIDNFPLTFIALSLDISYSFENIGDTIKVSSNIRF